MTAPLVEIDGVHKRFAGDGTARPAPGSVSATVPEAAVTGLIGPDGAGKTMLMRLVAGLAVPDSGTVRVFGRPAAALGPADRVDLGYLPQGTGLYADLTVDENLRLHADLRGVAPDGRARRIADILGRLDFAPFRARPAGKLSGGMAQSWRSPARWSRRPAFSCSTSRARASTRSPGASSGRSCAPCPGTA